MKHLVFLTFLILFLVYSCKQECKEFAQSTEYKYSVRKCVNGITDSITVIIIEKDHNTLCDCESYCNRVKEAVDNTIAVYDNIIDTTNSKVLRNQTLKDKEYLLKYYPKCKCE